MAVVPEGRGKRAVTHFETVEAYRHFTLLRFQLETGRTHQIRAHAQHLGHPLFGDATYGGDVLRAGPSTASRRAFVAGLLKACPRQALHAHTLGFRHPTTGEAVHFESPVPPDMAHVLDRLRAIEGDAIDA